MESFSDIATAAYCPRKLYYRRREGAGQRPASVDRVRSLSGRYPAILAGEYDLEAAPIAVPPATYREHLRRAEADLPYWPALADPPATDVHLQGKDCRGVIHKLVEEPLCPVLVSTGDPPEEGVWPAQSVRATAAAKALMWERETAIDRAVLEYPAHGVVREIRLTTRRKARYRRVLGIARSLDGPPPRLDDDARCGACEYRDRCGARTASLRSRLSR